MTTVSVIERAASVAKTLETAKGQAFPIDFAQLAHDLRELIRLAEIGEQVEASKPLDTNT